jgi:poly-gamma-glutamate capsule biosynthesis protein CapA/YwtB (metallophosphatase superfamily)
VLTVSLLSIGAACDFGPARVTYQDQQLAVSVVVFDELGNPLPSAVFTNTAGRRKHADSLGVILLEINQPVAGVISAPERLAEPLVVDPTDGTISIRLLDRVGDHGPRVALHFGGDTMLGRRYQAPIRNDTPRVADEQAARQVVSDLAPLMSASDITVVNLETVVGTLPDEQAYPGKRFLLQSPPLATALLDELGVDLATLANNHARDWLDPGIASTRSVLDEAGIPHIGAALDAEQARRGTVVSAGRRMVGVIALGTVSGDGVNDLLPVRTPGQAEAAPADPGSGWQYEPRTFGFGQPGDPGYIAPGGRWPGEIWAEFQSLEPSLSAAAVADLWAAITAPTAYPELQDWLARRGHGGAGAYDRQALEAEIDRLRREGAQQVIVQYHGGFQFTAAPSAGLRLLSQRAIDAGADMVISHHPHVLQGAEWYRGKLVVYSLGNLVFDQNFHVTYASALLRVVLDDSGLVEARFIPLVLESYRPVPVSGAAADRVLRMIAARSLMSAVSAPVDRLNVRSVQLPELPDGFQPAGVVGEHSTGKIVETPAYSVKLVDIGAQPTAVGPCVAVRVNDLPDGIEYGVDLISWGGFDDGLANRVRATPNWLLVPDSDRWEPIQGDSLTTFDDAVRLQSQPAKQLELRYVSLVARQDHEFWLPDLSAPADAKPSYTIELTVRRRGGKSPTIELAMYRMADEDGTKDPETIRLRGLELPVDVPDDGRWHRISLALESNVFEPVDGQPVDGVGLTLTYPPAFRASLDVDDLRLMEWRSAPAGEIPIWSEVDALRSDRARSLTVPTVDCASS